MSDYSSQASKAMLAITNQLKTGEISEEEFYRNVVTYLVKHR